MRSVKITLGFFAGALLSGVGAHGAESASAPAASVDPAKDTLVYVGTYTKESVAKSTSQGIYLFKLHEDGDQTSLVPLGLAAEAASPSFLVVDQKRRLLFATNELGKFQDQPGGAVSSFAIDPVSGKLTLLSQRPTVGTSPCYLQLDRTGRYLVVANYGSGSVIVYPVAVDGHLGEQTDFVQHVAAGPASAAATTTVPAAAPGKGAGRGPPRPRAHCVVFDPNNRFVYVCDLGLNQVLTYRFDAEHGKMTPNDPPFLPIAPGSGPRHMVLGPGEHFAYVVSEQAATVTVLGVDSAAGHLTDLQTISALPSDYQGRKWAAEIVVHPSGKFVYAANRAHDSLAIFAVDLKQGTLSYVENQGSGGKTPRNFAIDTSGKYLLVANQDSDAMQLNRIDPDTGHLNPLGAAAEVPMPTCVVFLPPAYGGR